MGFQLNIKNMGLCLFILQCHSLSTHKDCQLKCLVQVNKILSTHDRVKKLFQGQKFNVGFLENRPFELIIKNYSSVKQHQLNVFFSSRNNIHSDFLLRIPLWNTFSATSNKGGTKIVIGLKKTNLLPH